MPKSTGSVKKHRGVWTARVTYTDPTTGKRREVRRAARTKAEASDLRDSLLRSIRDTGGREILHERKAFHDLAAYYARHYVQPAEYAEGRKISGLRSHQSVAGYLAILGEYFGIRPLRSITYEDLRSCRTKLLKSPSRKQKRRSIAGVNRILATLRTMLNIAHREGWIPKNPFHTGGPLINTADEKKRERILTRAEEELLLSACESRGRRHLRPLLVAALDTGCRHGELLKLQWSDVNLKTRVMTIAAMHTKTLTERSVPISLRLLGELEQLRGVFDGEESSLVFGIRSNVKLSFQAARRIAGIQGLRFHDLRHTAATRWLQGGLPEAEVGRLLGHTEPKTTRRYINADATTLHRAVLILDRMHERNVTPELTAVN